MKSGFLPEIAGREGKRNHKEASLQKCWLNAAKDAGVLDNVGKCASINQNACLLETMATIISDSFPTIMSDGSLAKTHYDRSASPQYVKFSCSNITYSTPRDVHFRRTRNHSVTSQPTAHFADAQITAQCWTPREKLNSVSVLKARCKRNAKHTDVRCLR